MNYFIMIISQCIFTLLTIVHKSTIIKVEGGGFVTNYLEMENLCCNIKKIRLINNLSKREMAKRLKIDVRTLSSIEKGIIPSNANADIIFRLQYYFSVDAYDLFRTLI